MGKHRRKRRWAKTRKTIPNIQKKKRGFNLYAIIAAILILTGAGGIYAWRQTAQKAAPLQSAEQESKRPSGLSAIPRVPRPEPLPAEKFSGKIAQAYRVAREVPELIEQMPCYCNCYRGNGHQNNLDCYVDSHAAT